MKSTFGLAPIKKEGAAVHPDYIEGHLSDEQYIKQAFAYVRDTGDDSTTFVRDWLFEETFK